MRLSSSGAAGEAIEHGGRSFGGQRQFGRGDSSAGFRSNHSAIGVVALRDAAFRAGDRPGDVAAGRGLRDSARARGRGRVAGPCREEKQRGDHADARQQEESGPAGRLRHAHRDGGCCAGHDTEPAGCPTPRAGCESVRLDTKAGRGIHPRNNNRVGKRIVDFCRIAARETTSTQPICVKCDRSGARILHRANREKIVPAQIR